LFTNFADVDRMKFTYLILICFLAACGGGDTHFNKTDVTRISVGTNVFKVSVRDDLAEAVRVNPRYAPRLGPIREDAAFAMAQVSGGSVVGVLGDQALMTGVLECDAGRSAVPDRYAEYRCVPVKRSPDQSPMLACTVPEASKAPN
jgi:hypothetical protein